MMWVLLLNAGAKALAERWTRQAIAEWQAQWWTRAPAAVAAMGLASAWPCDRRTVERRYRELALVAHPDRPGGDAEAFKRLVRQRDQAIAAVEARWVQLTGRRRQ